MNVPEPEAQKRSQTITPAFAEEGVPVRKTQAANGVTTRSLAIALVLTLLSGMWVRQSEILVLATQVSESVPAIPGLAALVLLLTVNAMRRPEKRLARNELLFVFLFVAISSTVMGIGVVQFLIGLLASPFYYLKTEGEPLRKLLPDWLMPHDTEAVRGLFEGTADGRVPWHLWVSPGLIWMGFFLALWGTLYCMMALFYRAWAMDEKLSFPLVALPLEMTETAGKVGFFRNKGMWFGFALAAAYNLVNILHAFYPSVPAIGKEADFGTLFFTALPWSEMKPFSLHFRPELIGLGWLVATDISLSIWAGYLLLKLATAGAAAQGYEPHNLYPMEQGIGAYLMLAALFVWMARRRLLQVWKLALRPEPETGPEGLRYRTALVGLVVGFAALCFFTTAAGMAGWVAFVYLLLVFAVALVYGRMRAQTGVPMVWLFPYQMQKSVLLYTFGTQVFAASGPATLASWATFVFLAKGYFPTMTGYQIEAMELSRRTGIRARSLFPALTLAVAVGFILGWYHHLTPYYQHGAVHLRDGEIWGFWVTKPEYEMAAALVDTPHHTEFPRLFATCGGAILVMGLTLLRTRFPMFPLHPLGYAMTCCFGHVLWFPFFLVWLLKVLVLRYGGMRLYRQTIPFFLGFALGHLATAGIFWGLVGALFPETTFGYPVYFG